MLIEIHMIQNHSPSNLNRDDLGAPKTCVFGDTTRARISSQCIKRSIRRSPEFNAAIESDGGIRTRSLISEVAKRAHNDGEAPEKLIKLISDAFQKGGVKIDATKDDPYATNILFFIPRSGIDSLADAARAEYAKASPKADDLAGEFATVLPEKAYVPDIALSGRMTELDAQGPFKKLDFSVEAAMQVSHAISTHAGGNEVDYWTAADDLPSGHGAAHVNEAMFSSACFYKYFCIDWDQLVKNLTGSDTGRKQEAEQLAACTLGHFLRAAALTSPSGKQNSFAAQNQPSGILVEIKKNAKVPTSYANAFADPARKIGEPEDDAPDCVSLVGRSIAQFGDHVYSLRQAYGIDSTLLWFSPQLWRYPLQGWERAEDGRKQREPVRFADQHCNSLEGGEGGLVEAMINRMGLGFSWADAKDAGRIQQQEA